MAAVAAFAAGMFSFGSAAAGTLFSTAAAFGAAGSFYAGPTIGGCSFGQAQGPAYPSPTRICQENGSTR